jgi:hypothetical protein
MSEWKVFRCRISLFPAMPPSSPLPSALELYRHIWDSDPDSFHKQDNALVPTRAKGKRGGLLVNCVVQPARIDFNITPPPSKAPKKTVELIDDPSNLRGELIRIIDSFEKDYVANPVWRVALILHFLNPKPSYVEANRALTEAIPDLYGVTVTNEEEFIFQINRPHIDEKVPDIRMNFIMKWSVDKLQTWTFSIPTGGVPVQAGMTPPVSQPETVIAASVLFEKNNIPTRALSGKEQSTLLHEALDAAIVMQREIGLNIERF